jgi:hypothetical protein
MENEKVRKKHWLYRSRATAKRFSSTMNMPVRITLPVKFFVTAAIFQLFQNLVTDFKPRWRLQKSDRLVGILPLWPPRTQFVYRAADSFTVSVQEMFVNHYGRVIGAF